MSMPHFTRPAEFRGIPIPEVLLSGDHEKIRRWRRRSALAKTLRNRPDLLNDATLGKEDRRLLDEIRDKLQDDIGIVETPGIPFAKKP